MTFNNHVLQKVLRWQKFPSEILKTLWGGAVLLGHSPMLLLPFASLKILRDIHGYDRTSSDSPVFFGIKTLRIPVYRPIVWRRWSPWEQKLSKVEHTTWVLLAKGVGRLHPLPQGFEHNVFLWQNFSKNTGQFPEVIQVLIRQKRLSCPRRKNIPNTWTSLNMTLIMKV